ncbi:MAG: hypothetical protein AAGA77_06795 [Bacteroidota bacterium]
MNAISINQNTSSKNDTSLANIKSIKKMPIYLKVVDYAIQSMNMIKRESPILFWIAMVCFLLALGSLMGLTIDDRMLMGVNVWLKPLKFSISTGIYILTVGFLVNYYPYSSLKKKIINGLTAWTLIVELGIIVYQGARGVLSHYNMSSPIDGMLFAAMGILIGVNVFIMVLFVFDTLRLKMKTEKSVQWAMVIGWIVVIAGSWVGGQMIGQMSHNIGVTDGGEGLPFLNWSTIAGDLRVAHFFGIHGIQIIPLFAFGLTKLWKTSQRNQIIAVTLFGLIYAGWIAMTFYQAKQGMALLSL